MHIIMIFHGILGCQSLRLMYWNYLIEMSERGENADC